MSFSLSSLLAAKQAAPAQQAAAPLPYGSDPDAAVRQAWAYTLEDWAGMTDQQRNTARWNVSKAPHFSA
jgi:hypothetical protein